MLVAQQNKLAGQAERTQAHLQAGVQGLTVQGKDILQWKGFTRLARSIGTAHRKNVRCQ